MREIDDPLAPKNGKYRSVSISTTLPDTFGYLVEMYCERLQIKKGDLLRDAVKEYLEKRGITVI